MAFSLDPLPNDSLPRPRDGASRAAADPLLPEFDEAAFERACSLSVPQPCARVFDAFLLGSRREFESALSQLDTDEPPRAPLSLDEGTDALFHHVARCIARESFSPLLGFAPTEAPRQERARSYLQALLAVGRARDLDMRGRLDSAAEELWTTFHAMQKSGMIEGIVAVGGFLFQILRRTGKSQEACDVIIGMRETFGGTDAYDRARAFLELELCSVRLSQGDSAPLDRFAQNHADFIDRQRTSFTGWGLAPDFFLIMSKHHLVKGEVPQAIEAADLARKLASSYLCAPHLEQRIALQLVRCFSFDRGGGLDAWIAQHEIAGSAPSPSIDAALDAIVYSRALIMQGKARKVYEVYAAHSINGFAVPFVEFEVEYWISRAVASWKMGYRNQARVACMLAIQKARADRYLQLFVAWGPGLLPLLRDVADRYAGSSASWFTDDDDYFSSIIATCSREWSLRSDFFEPIAQYGEGESLGLTEAEQSVMSLLMTDKTTKEIAADLYISMSTLRTHMKSIYQKFDVHSRKEAVAKARRYL